MKEIRWILILMMYTSIFWYLIVSFIHWDIAWVTDIQNYTNSHRTSMIVTIVFKLIMDILIWNLLLKGLLKKDGKI